MFKFIKDLFKEKNYLPYLMGGNSFTTYRWEILEFTETNLITYEVKGFGGKGELKRHINYDNVVSIDYMEEDHEIKQEKSTIGRSLIGGALFGGTGAIVGALTSIKPKYKKTTLYWVEVKLSDGEVLRFYDKAYGGINIKFFTKMLYSYNNYCDKKVIFKEINN